MLEEISKLKNEFDKELYNTNSLNELSDLKVKYLGKKSKIQEFSSSMRDLSIDEKKEVGRMINEFKNYIENVFTNKRIELVKIEIEEKLEKVK